MKDRFAHQPIIDAHLHLWNVNLLNYPWLQTVPAINKTFLVEDYQDAVKNFRVEKMVFVQAECEPDQCMKEVSFVMSEAARDNRIQAIVAYAPMERGRQLKGMLDAYSSNNIIKGVRRMYDDDPSICTSPSFIDAANLLAEYKYSFDVSVKPSSWAATNSMIGHCPDTTIVIDHLGKPAIKGKELKAYQQNLDTLASFPNVVAKLSGLITEAAWTEWKPSDLKPYVAHAIDVFGYDRLMFGSDWPVVLLAGTADSWMDALVDLLGPLPDEAINKLFYENAKRIYRL